MSSQKRFLRFTLILLSGITLLALFPALVQGQMFVLKWGTYGTGLGQFNEPTGVAVDASGNVYLSDFRNGRVQKFDRSGNLLLQVGSWGTGDGQLRLPKGVLVDAAGNIYVSDAGNARIQKFDSNGNFLLKWGSYGQGPYGGPGQFDNPQFIDMDSAGNLYVADPFNHRVQKFTSNGVFLGQWGPGLLSLPTGIAVDASDNVYVVGAWNNQVFKFTSNGTLITQWGSFGSGNGQFNYPSEIAVDALGDVYVTDNHRVQKFTSNGTYLAQWGTEGSGNGQFNGPNGIAIDASGIYVADTGNHRVQKFSPPVVEVAVPTLTATYNEVLTLPVSVSDATGLVAAEVFVEYDTALLTVFSAPDSPTSSAGTLTQGWSVQTNTEPGAGTLQTLKIAVATDESAVTGPQTLINLQFTVNDVRVPASSPLTLTHVLLNDGTPANTPIDGLVTLVGNDGSVTSVPEQIVPRQAITVTVVDADLNTVFSTAQTVAVAVGNGAQSETLTLTETGVNTGQFTGAINTVFSLGFTSGDHRVQAKTGDVIVFTYEDALDAAGAGPHDRTDQTGVVGGTDGTVAISIASQPGDHVYVKVVDPDLSTPPLGYLPAATSLEVEVVNSRTSATVPVTLAQTAPASGIFVGTLPTTPGVEVGKMTSAEEDLLTVTYVDDLAANGAPQVDRTDANQVLNPWGDADDNEQLQAFDAALTLLEVLFPNTLTGLAELAANVNLDPVAVSADIDPYDASLILQHRVGLITTFPVQAATSSNHPQPNPASPKGMPQELALTLRAGDGYVSVWTAERDRIVSGDLLLAGVDGRAAMGKELGDFLLASRSTADGLRIVFAGAAPVSGPGELVRVYGVDAAEVRLTRAVFNNGQLEGTGTDRVASGSRPLRTTLHGNWPNPFNPETTIRFDLAQAGVVRLEVFDLLGQQVATLVAGLLPAGSHQVVWRGVDESGRRVSSGVYLYRLQTGDYTRMHRMLLLK